MCRSKTSRVGFRAGDGLVGNDSYVAREYDRRPYIYHGIWYRVDGAPLGRREKTIRPFAAFSKSAYQNFFCIETASREFLTLPGRVRHDSLSTVRPYYSPTNSKPRLRFPRSDSSRARFPGQSRTTARLLYSRRRRRFGDRPERLRGNYRNLRYSRYGHARVTISGRTRRKPPVRIQSDETNEPRRDENQTV